MEIFIIAFLILLNGIFSMSEIALVSSRKFKLENAAKKGSKTAKQALELANNPNTFLSTVQIGITLIGILTGIFSGDRLTSDLKIALSNIEALRPYADSLSVALIVIIITYFSIVFGELIPKRLGLTFPEAIASKVAAPMRMISVIAKPFVWLLGKTNDFFMRLFGVNEKREGAVSEEEINALVQQSTVSGAILEIEQDIVKRVFALGDRKVRELMTHRTDLIWFDISDDVETVLQKARSERHSVYPVADKSLDKLVGLVYTKEFFLSLLEKEDFNLMEYCRKPLFLHENVPAYKALEQFKSSRVHYGIVLDEYGSVEGMLTIDDVLDALVGDHTEYNQEEYQIMQRDDDSWLADGQYSYFELLQYFGLEEDTEASFTTIGGLILDNLHHIPVTGEKIVWNNYELEIVDMDGQRIDKVMITRLPPAEEMP